VSAGGDGRTGSRLARIEHRLLAIFGPAQLGRLGPSTARSRNRTEGVTGRWELRRDTTGRTYLVKPEDPGSGAS
jgi:hypothetical protein